MSSQQTLFKYPVDTTPKVGFPKVCDAVCSARFGKDEIVYRVEHLGKQYNIPGTVKMDELDSKATIYDTNGGYSAHELPKIKGREVYIHFAIYLAINYTLKNPHIVAYVNRCNDLCAYKTAATKRHIAAKEKTFASTAFKFYTQAFANAHNITVQILEKCAELPSTFALTEETFAKCVTCALMDMVTLYSYEKSSSFGFTSVSQRQFYLSRVATEEEEININILVDLVTPKKKVAGTGAKKTPAKGKGKKSVNNKATFDANDDEFVDDDALTANSDTEGFTDTDEVSDNASDSGAEDNDFVV